MRQFAVCLLCLAQAALPARAQSPVAAAAAAPAPAPVSAIVESEPGTPKKPAPPARASLRERLDEDAIRKAVKATLEETRENPRRHEADTISATAYEEFGREFHEAKVPDCLHPDGLKRQPTYFLGGLLALPFVAVAKIRGKCR